MPRRTHIGKRRQRRGKRRRRERREDDRGFVEVLVGPVWNRRLRIGVRAAGAALFALGCFVFLTWSQVIGQLLLAPSFGILMCILFFRWREKPEMALARRRVPFLVIGASVVAAGWVVFFVVDEELGLLLTLLGAAPLSALLLGVRHDTAAGLTDGPYFGETEGGA
jgi:hypothetical protein